MTYVMQNKQIPMVMALCFLTSMAAVSALAEDRKGYGAKTTAQEQIKGNAKDGGGGQLVLGELSRIEGEFYIIKKSDGKEVRLHVSQSSQKLDPIKQGDRVEAQIDDKNHVLSIHGQGSTDRRDLKDPDLNPK